jgi:hypothetical protein
MPEASTWASGCNVPYPRAARLGQPSGEHGVAMVQHKFKGDLVERHEVTIKGTDKTITFSVDSKDGHLVIRQEAEGKKPKDVCSITLADPEELGRFLEGLRRIVASLELEKDIIEPARLPGANLQGTSERPIGTEEREALIERARARIRRHSRHGQKLKNSRSERNTKRVVALRKSQKSINAHRERLSFDCNDSVLSPQVKHHQINCVTAAGPRDHLRRSSQFASHACVGQWQASDPRRPGTW